MINLEKMAQKLADIPFFQSFSQADRDALLAMECFAEYAPGECIIYQHGFDKTLFYLIEGAVRIEQEDKPDQPLARIVDPGSSFGELAFLTRNFRSANVWAETYTLVMRLDEATFKSLPLTIQSKIQREAAKKIIGNRQMIRTLVGN
ncbi:MAG: cyclic nucleotide-binding domain-containing protein [Magnetococcus sp. YQC-5]